MSSKASSILLFKLQKFKVYISLKNLQSTALVLLLERFHLYIHMSLGWYSSIHKVSYPWRNGIDCILAFMTWYILRWIRCIANGILTILQFDFTWHIWYFIETNLGIYQEQGLSRIFHMSFTHACVSFFAKQCTTLHIMRTPKIKKSLAPSPLCFATCNFSETSNVLRIKIW